MERYFLFNQQCVRAAVNMQICVNNYLHFQSIENIRSKRHNMQSNCHVKISNINIMCRKIYMCVSINMALPSLGVMEEFI